MMRKHDDDIETKKGSLRYHNIGLSEFKNNFVEIMEYYKGKRKQKADLIDSLIRDKDLIWTSKLPIYSSVLRPSSVTAQSFYFCSADRQINPLVNISINLKKANPIEVPLYLYQAQMRSNQLWTDTFTLIDGKNGCVRSTCLGGEFNHSGRSVIVLDPSLKINQVDLPYKAFIEQYKGAILSEIIKDKGWTITKATNYLASKFNFDPYVYSLMEKIIKEQSPKIILEC